MKKNLPLILIGGGILVVVLAVLVVYKSIKKSITVTPTTETEVIAELPQSQWPIVTLTPTSDPAIPNSAGHLLKFKVGQIKVPKASTLDYLLVYNTGNGGQQGVPGTIKLTGSDIEKNLVLGSESSGHYRFDDGVSQGTITLTFRDSEGKSLGKAESNFHYQTGETVLTSVDGKFTYTLDKVAKGVYFITMPTLVQPTDASSYVVWQNGYGVFASDGLPHSGK